MNFMNSLKIQFYLMIKKKNFRIAFTIMLLYTLLSYLAGVFSSMNNDISSLYSSDAWFIGNDHSDYFYYFEVLFPFLIVLPSSFSYFEDRSAKIHSILFSRMNIKDYYYSKLVCAFIGGFLVIIIPFLINIFLNILTFKSNGISQFGTPFSLSFYEAVTGDNVVKNTISKGMPGLSLYIRFPDLYNILFSFVLAIFSGFISIFSYSCSLIIKRYKILLFLITYAFMSIFNVLDELSYKILPSYINLSLLDYVTVNTNFGKSYLLFFIICLFLLLFSLNVTRYKIRQEQI